MKAFVFLTAALFLLRASCTGAPDLDFSFDFPEDLSPTVSANQVVVLDWDNGEVDNDSRPDFVILDRLKQRLSVIYQTTTGVSEPVTLYQLSNPPESSAITLLRINEDYHKDLVLQDGSSLFWWEVKADQPPLFKGKLLELPDELFSLAEVNEQAPRCTSLDFDQDGRDDLLFHRIVSDGNGYFFNRNLHPALQTAVGQFTLKTPSLATSPIESGSFSSHHWHSFTNNLEQTEVIAWFRDTAPPSEGDYSDPETTIHTLVYDLTQNEWILSELPDSSLLQSTPIDLDGDSFPEFLTSSQNANTQSINAQKLGPDGTLSQLWEVSGSEVEDANSQRYYRLPISALAGNFDLDPEQEILVSFPFSEEMFIVEHNQALPGEPNIIKLRERDPHNSAPPSTESLQDFPQKLLASHDLDEDGFDELLVSLFIQDSDDFTRLHDFYSPQVIAFSDRDAFPPCDPSLWSCFQYPYDNFGGPIEINPTFFPGKMILAHTDEDSIPDLVALDTVTSSGLLTWRSGSSLSPQALSSGNSAGFRGSSLTRELQLGDKPHPLVSTNQGSYTPFFGPTTYQLYQKSYFNSLSLEQSHSLNTSSDTGLFPPHTLALADFDQDLLPDLLEIDSTQGLIVCRFGGSSGSSVISLVPYWVGSNGTFGNYSTNWIEPHQVLVADPDNDGDLDIFMSISILGSGPVLYRNNGDRTFSVESLTNSYAPKAGPLLSANIDNNGIPDLIFLQSDPENQGPFFDDNCEIIVLPDWGTGQGYTVASIEFQSAAHTAIATGDLNEDGLDDFVFGHRPLQGYSYFDIQGFGFQMALNTGEGTLGETISVSTNLVAPEDLLIHDLDQDGRQDVLLSSILSGSLLWVRNVPSTPSPSYSEWASTHGLSEISQTENPDGDQLSNLEEWFFGTEPLVDDRENIPEVHWDPSVGQAPYSALEIIRSSPHFGWSYNFNAFANNKALNEWELLVQFSNDLENWTPLSVFKSLVPGTLNQTNLLAYEFRFSSEPAPLKRFFRYQLVPVEPSTDE